MKQTAVEWLVEKYELVGVLTTPMVERAKAMEKEQIEDAHIEGQRVFDNHPHSQWNNDQADVYYKETYKRGEQ